jgi:hypothetical protein
VIDLRYRPCDVSPQTGPEGDKLRIAIILAATLLGAAAKAPPQATANVEEAILQAARADPAGTGEQQMNRARALAMLGRNEEALMAADAAAATSPYDFGLSVGRGEVLDQMGRRTQALASYRVGLECSKHGSKLRPRKKQTAICGCMCCCSCASTGCRTPLPSSMPSRDDRPVRDC